MRFVPSIARMLFVAAVVPAFAACSGLAGSTPPAPNTSGAQTMLQGVRRDSSGGKIKHVIIIVQENRSFNNLFMGVPGATTQNYGYDTNGNKITLQPIGLETTWDIEHDSYGYLAACNGTGSFPGTDCQMNGFDKRVLGMCEARRCLPEQESAVQLRSEIGDQAVLRKWRSTTRWPTRCSPRTSTQAASSRTSTSSPPRQARP